MDPRILFQAAIFDFDGVLADTIPLHFESFRRLFEAEGVRFTFEDYQQRASGAPRDRVIRAILGEEIPAAKMRSLMDRKEEILLDLIRDQGLRPIDGALELVKRLRSLGLRTGMASSSRTAVRFLEAIGGRPLFDAVTDAREAVRPKPHPEVFLATAGKLGVEPRRCLVFEDALLGIRAARAAGMKVVAITTTCAAGELRDADWVIESFADYDPLPILCPPPEPRPAAAERPGR